MCKLQRQCWESLCWLKDGWECMISFAPKSHLASADGKEDGALAPGNGIIVRLHNLVKGFSCPMGLTHQGLCTLQLSPYPCCLCKGDKSAHDAAAVLFGNEVCCLMRLARHKSA